VKAVDTNILVRLVTRDDERQAAAAEALVESGDTLILPTVVLETEWVLRSRYGLSRRRIADGLATLLGQPGIAVVSGKAVAAALAAYAKGGDFADLLHFALAAEQGATDFVTFDRDFAAVAGAGPQLKILP
jgi:predicted nucleic-acid-binding protein